MATRVRTRIDIDGLLIHADPERQLPLWVGAMHYWRTAPGTWSQALDALRQLGCTAVESPVPWSVHEPTPGAWRWSGARDLRAFVERAGAVGLAVILRPGPHANVELTGHGFPDDVLRDSQMQARTARDTPAFLPNAPRALALPSYASAHLHQRVARWYAALAEQLSGLLAPEGPVAALVLEAAPARFRGAAFDLDYHPEALARWAEEHPRWPEPPRAWSPDDAERCLAWVAFKEQEQERAFVRFSDALREAGLGGLATLRHQDLEPAPHAPAPRLLSAHGPRPLPALRRAARRAFGAEGVLAETGVGDAAWLPPAGGADADKARALTLLACGARGLSFSMAVERERWAGALLDERGQPLPESGWAWALLRALHEVQWHTLRRRAPVALLRSSGETRLALASSLLDPFTPWLAELLRLGPAGLAELSEDSAARAARWLATLEQALERAGVGYVVLDEDAALDEMTHAVVIIAPVAQHGNPAAWATLRELLARRRVTVVASPWPPELDELGRPWQPPPLSDRDALRRGRVGKLRAGSLEDVAGLVQDLEAIAPPSEWSCLTPDCVLEQACDNLEVSRVLFLFNDATTPRTAELRVSTDDRTPSALREVFSGARVEVRGEAAAVELAPNSVAMFLIEA